MAPKGDLTRPRKRPGIFSSSAALLAAALFCPGLAHAGTITFCVDKANPMLPTDMAVARAVAQKAGDVAAFVVRDSTKADSDGDDDGPKGETQKTLQALGKQCDLVMGFPMEAGGGNIPEGMSATRPYVRTGFVAVGQGDVSGGFAGLLRAGNIGVLNMSPATTYFTVATMSHEHVYFTNEQLYGAMLDGEVKTALIWKPWLNQQLSMHPHSVHVAELSMPYANWNVVALYPQTAQDSRAVKDFNEAITSLTASHQLGGVVKPYDAPVKSVSKLEE
ncbi:hypothetical protein [Acidocella sp.]|uniref:hypothetical protein n=1 Tax=Acidocella sp. TaxID=50710 RepID=UPI003D057A5C